MGTLRILVGKKIRFYRQQLGLNQESFAEMAEINKNYLGNLELGKQTPSVAIIKKIANAVNVSMSEFFKDL